MIRFHLINFTRSSLIPEVYWNKREGCAYIKWSDRGLQLTWGWENNMRVYLACIICGLSLLMLLPLMCIALFIFWVVRLVVKIGEIIAGD